jgi:hypothetical protein
MMKDFMLKGYPVRRGTVLFSYPSREMARWRVTEG